MPAASARRLTMRAAAGSFDVPLEDLLVPANELLSPDVGGAVDVGKRPLGSIPRRVGLRVATVPLVCQLAVGHRETIPQAETGWVRCARAPGDRVPAGAAAP